MIANHLRRGFRYLATGQLLAYGIRFGSNLLLARLLAPDLFGLVAVGAAFIYASAMLCDIGLRSAIIQNPRADDRRYRDIVWTVMSLRVLVFLAMLGAAITGLRWSQAQGWLPADSLYTDPRLPLVLMLLAAAESLRFLESVEIVYHERQMHFRLLFGYELSRQVIGTVTTITWSLVAPSVVALCAGSLVANAAMTLWSYLRIAGRGPRWIWSTPVVLDILRRGRWLLVSAVLTFAMNMLDRVYLARYFDATYMGLYAIALVFGTVVIELVNKIGASVIFPALSERVRSQEGELWQPFYQSRRNVLKVSLAVGFFFIAFGDDLIRWLYDPRYHAAGEVLQAFGLVALLAFYAPSGDAYLALGQAKIKSVVYGVRVVTLLVAMGVMVPEFGLVGGVWALAASHAGGALATLAFNRHLGLFRWQPELRALAAMGGVLLAGSTLARL